MFSIFIPLLLIPNLYFQEAVQKNRASQYEESEALFKLIDPRTVDREQYHYYRLVNNYMTNNKEGAERHLKELDGFDSYRLPYRHQVLLAIMADEVKNWQKNNLADIAREMQNVQNRLAKSKIGHNTQKTQKRIVKNLDKIIDELEKQKEEEKQKQEKQQQQGQQQSKNQQQGPNPQDDSMPGQDSGPGDVNHKLIREYAPIWGKLPARDRESIMRDITRDMPPRYKEIIMEYFRKLSQQGTETRP